MFLFMLKELQYVITNKPHLKLKKSSSMLTATDLTGTPVKKVKAKPKRKTIDLISTIGVEFTFVKSVFDATSMSELVQRFQNATGFDERVIHTDSDACEVTSPIFTTYDQLNHFYLWINEVAESLGLHGIIWVTENDITDRLPTGGGHINLGYPKLTTKDSVSERLHYLKNLTYILNFNPYITWIFNEPQDNDSAKHLGGYLKADGQIDNLRTFIQSFKTETLSDFSSSSYITTRQTNPITCYNPTAVAELSLPIVFERTFREQRRAIEFRNFNAYEDEQDLFICVDFVNQLALKCNDPNFCAYNFVDVTDHIQEQSERLAKIKSDVQFCISEFNDLCNLIDVDPTVYHNKIVDNLEHRFELGDSFTV